MKYRILEKTLVSSSGKHHQIFFAQKKVWYWPFWIYMSDYHYWELDEAKTAIMVDSMKTVKHPTIIHHHPQNKRRFFA